MPNILEIVNLKKSYSVVQALKGVSFNVSKGAVFGILGPNGSGKTTLLGILLDVLKANEGGYSWLGYGNSQMARRHIGSLLETPNFYHYLTARQNLKISAKIKGRGEEQIDEVLMKVNLLERADFPFQSFSLGMKQRLAIAAALLGDPEILVFDEPTNGLDPVGITEIRELMMKLSQSGITIIMASHLLDEVEKVCTDVAILKQGVLLSCGPVSEVLNEDDWYEIGSDSLTNLMVVIEKHPELKQIKQEKLLLVSFKSSIQSSQLNEFCHRNGIVLNHLLKRKRSLESKFMELTK